jgi:hypothetical protein
MNYDLFKKAKYRSGFETRVAQLIVKDIALSQMQKEAGIGSFIGKGVGLMRGALGGSAARLGEAAGGVAGAARGFGANIAKGYSQGTRAGFKAVAGRAMPRANPAAAAGPAMNHATAPAAAAATAAAPPPSSYGGVGAARAQSAASRASGLAQTPAANGSGGSFMDSLKGIPGADWAKENPAVAGAIGGAAGQNLYDWNSNRMRKNEMQDRLANMGFGDRLGMAFSMMTNPRGFAENAADQTFQPTLMSRL